MKKRVLGLLTAAAMLFSALPVFAVGEIPSDDNLIWYNDGTRASDFNAPAEGKREVDGNAIKMTATYNGDKVLNYQIQKTDLKFSKSSDISAILSFKIKAGQTDKHFNMALRHEWKEVVEGKEQEETKGSEITLFAMSANGKLAYSDNGAWIGDRSGFSGNDEYTAGTWYDVSMVLNKTERKIYYYIDGKLYGTAAVADDKFAFDSQQLILKSTVTIGSNLSPELGEANFWLDDIMWLSGSDNSFYAFTDSDEYPFSSPKVNIKLTEQAAKDADLTGVTVHKVRDNSTVNATADLTSARNIEVKINGTLSPEEEYRIDIPSLKSVTGKKIYNDSVYFMTASERVETIFSDDFSKYDTNDKNGNQAGEFYKPVKWYTNTNWADQYSTLKPLETTQSDGTTGKVAEFKKQNNDKEAGTYGWAAIYRAFGNDKKINSGILTVEYDVKAMKAQNVKEAGKVQSQLLLGVYKDALTDEEYTYPDSTDSSVLVKNVIGREAIANGTVPADNVNNKLQFVGGVQGGAICRFMDNTSLTDGYYHLDGGKDAVWNIDDTQDWRNVKVTFDYNNKTVKTNVDGAELGTPYPMSNFGIEDGISAISFGSSMAGNAFTKDIYLDNVTVKHDTSTPKVSKVRFINGDGVESGITNSVSTLNEKVKITFANGAIDAESVNGITLKDNSGKTIELKDGSLNADRTVYTATLGDLMKVNTDYTLSVSGLTSVVAPVEDYTATFKTEQTGHFIVSKPYIKGEIADNGEITIGIKAINTTGEGKAVTFSYAKYSGNQMTECMLEPSQSVGGDKPALYAKEYNITLSPDEAAKLTEIKAFAWGDITSVVPLTDFAAVTKTVSGN